MEYKLRYQIPDLTVFSVFWIDKNLSRMRGQLKPVFIKITAVFWQYQCSQSLCDNGNVLFFFWMPHFYLP